MIWFIAEALLALALLVGVIVWVALPAQRRRVAPPRKEEDGTPSPAAESDSQEKAPPAGDAKK